MSYSKDEAEVMRGEGVEGMMGAHALDSSIELSGRVESFSFPRVEIGGRPPEGVPTGRRDVTGRMIYKNPGARTVKYWFYVQGRLGSRSRSYLPLKTMLKLGLVRRKKGGNIVALVGDDLGSVESFAFPRIGPDIPGSLDGDISGWHLGLELDAGSVGAASDFASPDDFKVADIAYGLYLNPTWHPTAHNAAMISERKLSDADRARMKNVWSDILKGGTVITVGTYDPKFPGSRVTHEYKLEDGYVIRSYVIRDANNVVRERGVDRRGAGGGMSGDAADSSTPPNVTEACKALCAKAKAGDPAAQEEIRAAGLVRAAAQKRDPGAIGQIAAVTADAATGEPLAVQRLGALMAADKIAKGLAHPAPGGAAQAHGPGPTRAPEHKMSGFGVGFDLAGWLFSGSNDVGANIRDPGAVLGKYASAVRCFNEAMAANNIQAASKCRAQMMKWNEHYQRLAGQAPDTGGQTTAQAAIEKSVLDESDRRAYSENLKRFLAVTTASGGNKHDVASFGQGVEASGGWDLLSIFRSKKPPASKRTGDPNALINIWGMRANRLVQSKSGRGDVIQDLEEVNRRFLAVAPAGTPPIGMIAGQRGLVDLNAFRAAVAEWNKHGYPKRDPNEMIAVPSSVSGNEHDVAGFGQGVDLAGWLFK